MKTLPVPQIGKISLLVAPRRLRRELMSALIVQLALASPV